jgi:hypothetical protein
MEKYSRGGVRDHILRMSNVAVRLRTLDLAIKDGFLIYLIFNSLPKEFETFEVSYISMNENWTLEKFTTMCVREEERIKRNNCGFDSVNKKMNFVSKSERGRAWSCLQLKRTNASGALTEGTIRRTVLSY